MTGISNTIPEPSNPTYTYVGAFVNELQRGGLQHAVICPGSRSTPLAMTLAATPTIHCWMHIDERSAAFFALGLAKRLNQPIALLCTSGTAAANFLPAIVEAHLTHVPLLVLTADRPPELRDCGAPQAIDQNRLYGTHVKWFVEVAMPEASNEALRYIRTIACRALAQTHAVPTGPVHLNMPFREPLTPAPIPGQPLPPVSERNPLAWQGRPDDQPYVQIASGRQTYLQPGPIKQTAEAIKRSPQGLILVGPQTDPWLARVLIRLAHATGYPILADPLSQLRGCGCEEDGVLVSYDAFLRSERFASHYQPELILRFGAMPSSKSVLLYLKQHATCPQIIVDPQQGWEEPALLASQMIYLDPSTFAGKVILLLETPDDQIWLHGANDRLGEPARREWSRAWLAAEQATRGALAPAIADLPALFEGRVFTELAKLLPAGALLYAGNSMPIRDMDTFFWPPAHAPYCLGNRGAMGIDGVISSALGASAAGGSEEPVVLVVGDLSFFHDLNGLLAAHLHKLNLMIILVNNDGGGIFSFLPQAAYPERFEQLFGTPTGLDFRPVVEMYGGTFQRIADWEMFRHTLQVGLAEGGLHVIEVPTERESNVAMHRQLWRVVEQALTEAGILARGEQ